MLGNKAEIDARVAAFGQLHARNCVKLRGDVLVFPDIRSCPLLDMFLCQMLRTKEQPNGCYYPSDGYRVVLRLLDGKVFLTEGGLPDVDTWTHARCETQRSIRALGFYSSSEACTEAERLLLGLRTEEDRRLVEGLLRFVAKDFYLVSTEEENCRVIEVTPELYSAGLTYIVDEWMQLDSDGCAEVTLLSIGDFVVLTNSGCYCIRGQEFWFTHRLI